MLPSSSGQAPYSLHFSSVKLLGDDTVVAAPLGRGIKRKRGDGPWERMDEGLPADTHVNRLQVDDRTVFACADADLFEYDGAVWRSAGLGTACLQYRSFAGWRYAATTGGIRFATPDNPLQWQPMTSSRSVVYDFLILPEFIVLGTDKGLSIYDRYTQRWMHYRIGAAVTSLAVFWGVLVGVTDRGELLVGNGSGGFDSYRIGKLFLFALSAKGEDVFACADQGLYRLNRLGARCCLSAVKLGCQVTDADTDGNSIYMATLFEGIQVSDRR